MSTILPPRQVENETYRMIDTLFLKSPFLPKNTHFTQCPCAFRDFSKIAFFDPPQKIFFCNRQKSRKICILIFEDFYQQPVRVRREGDGVDIG